MKPVQKWRNLQSLEAGIKGMSVSIKTHVKLRYFTLKKHVYSLVRFHSLWTFPLKTTVWSVGVYIISPIWIVLRLNDRGVAAFIGRCSQLLCDTVFPGSAYSWNPNLREMPVYSICIFISLLLGISIISGSETSQPAAIFYLKSLRSNHLQIIWLESTN